MDSGLIQCWGFNPYGQIGNDANTIMPSFVLGIDASDNVSQLIVIQDNICVLLSTGKMKCWGDNTYGQLGIGNTTDVSTPPASAIVGIP